MEKLLRLAKVVKPLNEILLVVFVVLKLAGLVAWSWWLVVSPLLVSLALVAPAFIDAALRIGTAKRKDNQ